MSEWGTRIAQRRKELGMSVAELARQCSLRAPSVHDWEKGKTKTIEGPNLMSVAAALQTTPEWILSGRGAQPKDSETPAGGRPTAYLRPITLWDDPSELPDDQFVFLPKLDYYLSAGHGGPDPAAVEQTDKLNPFRSDWAKAQGWSPRTHFTMRCKGDSMEPTIQDNAPVVIDTSSKGKRIQSGKVYAIVIDGEALLKRLDKLPGGVIRVRSDNTAPQYQPYEVPEAALEIVGRAVWTPVNL
jgi:phage repressor protein C with HTH and peptisase S24 domain